MATAALRRRTSERTRLFPDRTNNIMMSSPAVIGLVPSLMPFYGLYFSIDDIFLAGGRSNLGF